MSITVIAGGVCSRRVGQTRGGRRGRGQEEEEHGQEPRPGGGGAARLMYPAAVAEH